VEEYLVVDVTWNDKQTGDYLPGLLLQTNDGKHFFNPITEQEIFSLKVSKYRLCIGYEESRGVWRKCPFNNPPVEGSFQCLTCMEKDFFACRKSCNGIICRPSSKEAKQLCSTMDTTVYVTHVGGRLKVGVSLNPLKRWLDQGSLFGAVVFKTYGLEARRIERELAKKLNAKLSVRRSTKVNQLITGFNIENSKKELERALEAVKTYVPNVPHIRENPKIVDLTKYFPNLKKLLPVPKEIDMRLNQEFGGKFMGMIGKIIVFKNNRSYYYIHGNSLIGKKISFQDKIPKIKGQQSLYDFF